MAFMSHRRSGLPLALCLVFVAVAGLPVWAFSPHLDDLTGRYHRSFSCEVCHDGTKLNRFGQDFRFVLGLEGGNSLEALKFIEWLDSDGDGWANGDELRAGTYPGNRASFPRESPSPAITPVPRSPEPSFQFAPQRRR